LPATGFCL